MFFSFEKWGNTLNGAVWRVGAKRDALLPVVVSAVWNGRGLSTSDICVENI